jgi:hypothetical protein
MNFQDVLTIIGCIVTFILGVGFNEVYHLRKDKKEDKVLEFEKATYQDLARTLADANMVLTNQISILEQFLESQQKRINQLGDEVCDKLREIETLKSKRNTDIPTLDRNSCTLSTGLTIQRVWVKPTRNDWDSIVSKCPYPNSNINDAWSKRIVYALICDLLSFHGFTHNGNGDMENPYTGKYFLFEYLKEYKSVEAFQKDWPYK